MKREKNKVQLKRKLKSNKNALPLIILFFVVLFSIVGYFYILNNNSSQQTGLSIPKLEQMSPTTSRSGKNEIISTDNKQFRAVLEYENYPGDIFSRVDKHPVDLIFTNKSSLVPIRCSNQIVLRKYDSSIIDNDKINSFVGQLDSRPDLVLWCETESGQTIVSMEKWNEESVSKNEVTIGYLNSNYLISNPTLITTNDPPFFECGKPLALTQDDKLYIQCDGGDDISYGKSSIYLVDLSAGDYSEEYSCKSSKSGIDCSY